MAAGFRSYGFRWFTGYSAAGAAPAPSCPCPDWTVEQTLVSAFCNPLEISSSAYSKDETLDNAFKSPNEIPTAVYTKPITLQSAWQRKACE
jgi:hypothetical protein